MPRPFHVLATQNPIEQEGTYPLPEAQLDRFLLAIDITYPEIEAERAMLLATTGAGYPGRRTDHDAGKSDRSPDPDPPHAGRRGSAVDAILTMWCAAAGRRKHRPRRRAPSCRLGTRPPCLPGLDAGVHTRELILGGRADAPSLDDVVALAGPVLRHRMALEFFPARADGIALDEVIGRLGRTSS